MDDDAHVSHRLGGHLEPLLGLVCSNDVAAAQEGDEEGALVGPANHLRRSGNLGRQLAAGEDTNPGFGPLGLDAQHRPVLAAARLRAGVVEDARPARPGGEVAGADVVAPGEGKLEIHRRMVTSG